MSENPSSQHLMLRPGLKGIVLADGGASVGMGHVVRSLALALELRRLGCEIKCFGHDMSKSTALSPAFNVLSLHDTSFDVGTRLALETTRGWADFMVIDGYHFTEEFFVEIERLDIPYIVLDDDGETTATNPAVVINHNPHALVSMYTHLGPSTELFLGLDYALIRQEVRELVAGGPDRGEHIVVSMGATDPASLTAPVARALVEKGFSVQVACKTVSGGERESSQLLYAGEKIEFFDPAELPVKLASCRAAVVSSGTTMFEAIALGTPTVSVVVSPNQLKPVRSAVDSGLVGAGVIGVGKRNQEKVAAEIVREVTNLVDHKFLVNDLAIHPDGAANAAAGVLSVLGRIGKSSQRVRRAVAEQETF